jgi:NAD(P)-dependent dehydrogenase (short-subunit alcohol dehydrogenase family)
MREGCSANSLGYNVSASVAAEFHSEDVMTFKGKVALVAGATRGAGRGIAVELGACGATVYCNGRSTRTSRSEMNRPETIEETAALDNYRNSFFDDLPKAAVLRMVFALGHDLKPHGATVVSLTPGWLRSEAMLEAFRVAGRAVAALAQDPHVSRWNGRSLSSGQLARVYGFTDLDGSQPDAWRYLVEVQDKGKPADVSGYR